MKRYNPHSLITHTIINKITRTLMATVLLLGCALCSRAQLNPLQSMYFQNPYLYNPAMAGISNSLNINLDYSQPWSSFPGMPKTATFTADFQPTNKVGLGLNIYNDVAGLITQTRIMGTYAYHLPLSEDDNQKLSFGVSLGVNNSRVDPNAVNGDPTDPEIVQYNQLKPYIDGDFGIAYTSSNLSVSGAIPNLKSAFFKSSDERFDADRLVFIAVASYKIMLQNEDRGFMIEPLAGYRIVTGNNNIFDAGFNFGMQNTGIYLESMYHTSHSASFGFGIDRGSFALNFDYNVVTSQLANYSNGAFELGIKVRLFKKSENAK